MNSRAKFYIWLSVIIIGAALMILGLVVKSLECLIAGGIMGYIGMLFIGRGK